MTDRAVRRAKPKAAEIKAAAEILRQHWRPARSRLERYFEKDTWGESAGRMVRVLLIEVFKDTTGGVAIPPKKRLELYEYAQKYGTYRAMGEEAKTDRHTVRFRPSETDLMTAAAELADVPLGEYIRDAVMSKAQRDMDAAKKAA